MNIGRFNLLRQIYLVVILFLIWGLNISAAYGLVDYSDRVSSNIVDESRFKVRADSSYGSEVPYANSNEVVSTKRSRSTSKKFLELKTSYKSITISAGDKDGKVDVLGVSSRVDTEQGIFVDLSYWQASSNSSELANKTSYQPGNPLGLVGINWFQVGAFDSAARADLYGGFSLKASGSDFGSSRNDQIVGVEISKSFSNLALVVGARYRLAGKPSNSEEMSIGNINRLSAGLGYLLSDDIRFSVEGFAYRVAASDDEVADNALKEKLSFSSVVSKLILNISPMVQIELGATFRTKKIGASKAEKALQAKLYDLHGSYGNSLRVGMNISI